jgi:hypothetical protein
MNSHKALRKQLEKVRWKRILAVTTTTKNNRELAFRFNKSGQYFPWNKKGWFGACRASFKWMRKHKNNPDSEIKSAKSLSKIGELDRLTSSVIDLALENELDIDEIRFPELVTWPEDVPEVEVDRILDSIKSSLEV